jgi:hypothetical protein
MGQIRRDNVLGRLTGLASQCWRGQRGENDGSAADHFHPQKSGALQIIYI